MPVITFSRYYPKGHPKAGQPTHFIEKVLKSLIQNDNLGDDPTEYSQYWCELLAEKIATVGPLDVSRKYHTIRSGNRWKVGDKFSPRVWGNDINPKTGRSGPRQSKQITFAPDIEIKKVWGIIITPAGSGFSGWLLRINKVPRPLALIDQIAKNDGLTTEDFKDWFGLGLKPMGESFVGQIICWNESIEYNP